jgi:hypothetical protein
MIILRIIEICIITLITHIKRIDYVLASCDPAWELQPVVIDCWSHRCRFIWNYRLIIVRFRRFITPGASAG